MSRYTVYNALGEEIDLASWSVSKLKSELLNRDRKATGNKQELIHRLLTTLKEV